MDIALRLYDVYVCVYVYVQTAVLCCMVKPYILQAA